SSPSGKSVDGFLRCPRDAASRIGHHAGACTDAALCSRDRLMPLDNAALKDAFARTPLFEDKTWRLSPEAWPLTRAQLEELREIGSACLEFHRALETLYLRSVAGKNLLRNKPLIAPWVAEYLDRGKPEALVAHARDARNRGAFPAV